MTTAQPHPTYADLQPGDRFQPNADRPFYVARRVATISAPYVIGNDVRVVEIVCTDGYAVEVLANAPLRIAPR